MRGLRFAQTDLAHLAARITDGENGNRMPAAAGAPLATGTVTNPAIQQRAAEKVAGFRQLRHKSVTFADDLLLRH
jgi:hypothetical protein